ncbi:hypothetical protein [Mesorhizobium sp.]|uniref:hypothetical protein n=1 Tax=Mesorhizobium sp. TaxID=1871066 RepID=UPI000FE59862|nr:hypothetical protein [Mesorhizobium sp.]RWA64413.1 MAG: hypothetical protein EOQ27_09720 [Mesorhizobium sp.]
MTVTAIDLSVWAEAFEGSAEWRRQKAKEFPEDAARNLEAAAEVDSLAAQFNAGDVDPDLVAEYESLGDNDIAHRVVEVESELLRQVGFYEHFAKADDFVSAVIKEARGNG